MSKDPKASKGTAGADRPPIAEGEGEVHATGPGSRSKERAAQAAGDEAKETSRENATSDQEKAPSGSDADTPEGEGQDAPPATTGQDTPAEPAAPSESEEEAEALRARLKEMMDEAREDRESVKALKEQLSGLTENLGNLQQLSELVSIRYNPFLDEQEPSLFDGPANPVTKKMRKAAGKPGVEVVRPDLDGPEEEDEVLAELDRPEPPTEGLPGPAPDEVHQEVDERAPVEPAPPAEQEPPSAPSPPLAPAPSREAQVPPAAPAEPARQEPAPGPAQPPPPGPPARAPPSAPPPPATSYNVPRRVRPPHQGLMALRWFEHIIREVPAPLLHPVLGQYRQMGWLSDEDHEWLTTLAYSIVPPDPEVNLSSVPVDPLRLIHLHQSSLRFLDILFQHNLDPATAEALMERAQGALQPHVPEPTPTPEAVAPQEAEIPGPAPGPEREPEPEPAESQDAPTQEAERQWGQASGATTGVGTTRQDRPPRRQRPAFSRSRHQRRVRGDH